MFHKHDAAAAIRNVRSFVDELSPVLLSRTQKNQAGKKSSALFANV